MLRIVGEERQKVITLNPTNIDLYSVLVENKKDGTGYHRISDNSIAGHPSTITIQDMLKGVNDSQGNPYFQKAYHGFPYAFSEFKPDDNYADGYVV